MFSNQFKSIHQTRYLLCICKNDTNAKFLFFPIIVTLDLTNNKNLSQN